MELRAAMVVALDEHAREALRQAGYDLAEYGLRPEQAKQKVGEAYEAIGRRLRELLDESGAEQ